MSSERLTKLCRQMKGLGQAVSDGEREGKAHAFLVIETRAWHAAHPGHQGDPPEDEQKRMIRDAWLLAHTGREPGVMT